MRKIGAVMLMVVACAAVAAGCSSSDKEAEAPATTTTTAAALTKAEFIAQADKLCAAAQRALNELPVDPNADAETIGAIYLEQGVPLQRQLMLHLRELPLPAGEEQAINAIFEQVDEAIDDSETGLKTDPAAFLNGPNVFGAVNKVSAEYGFGACAE